MGYEGKEEFLQKAFNLFDLDHNGIIDHRVNILVNFIEVNLEKK